MNLLIRINKDASLCRSILDYIEILFPEYTFELGEIDKYEVYPINILEDLDDKEYKKIIEEIKKTSLHFYDKNNYVYN